MIKKLISAAILATCILFIGVQQASSATATPAAKPADKATTQPAEKQAKKNTAPSEDKYPTVYAKCTKEAEADETKYDQIFDSCMDKNGFPQEEFNTDGEPIDSGDTQD